MKRIWVIPVLVILISVSVTGAYAINITLGGTVDITQILNMMNNKIINVASPTVNTDAATKGYVDSVALSGTPGIIDADTLDGIDSTGFSQGSHTVDTNTDTVPWNSRVPQSTSLTTVDSTGNVGQYTSITIGTDGLPVISYYDATNDDLKVVHCTNTSCSTFDTPTTVDSAGFFGQYTSITIGTDGLPVISYWANTDSKLKVAKCTNPICQNNWIRR